MEKVPGNFTDERNGFSTELPTLKEDLREAILVPCIGIYITAVIGIFGNLWFLLIIIFIKELHKPHYRLVAGVIVCDIATNAVSILFETTQTVVFVYFGYEVGDSSVCQAEVVFYSALSTGSALGQCLVAINRGLAVFKPIFHRQYITKRLVTIVITLVAGVYPLLFFIGISVDGIQFYINQKLGDCDEKYLSAVITDVTMTLNYYIPIAVSLFLYSAIFFRIVFTKKVDRAEILQRARGSFTMFVCMLVFAICFFCYPISIQIGIRGDNPSVLLWFNAIFRFSYGLNPIFYILFDSQFQTASRKFFNIYMERKGAHALQSTN